MIAKTVPERDWNVEFQEIMDQDPSPSKYLALATLAHDVSVSLPHQICVVTQF